MRINFDFKKIWSVVLLCYIICSTAFIYGELRILNTVFLYLFLAVSVLLILIRGRLHLHMAVISYIAYAVVVLVGMLYTPTFQSRAMGVMYNYLTGAVLAFCVAQYIETEKDLNLITVSFMLGGFALAVYVYAQYGNEFWDLLKEIAKSDSDHVMRLDGNLANANSISMYAMVSAMIAVYYIFFTKTKTVYKVLCILLAVFCLVVSLAAASKKSMLIMLISLFGMWMYAYWGKLSTKKILQGLLVLLVTVVVLIYAINALPIFSGVIKRFESLFDFLGGGRGTISEVERFSMIENGLDIWSDHPIFGAGTASTLHYFGVYSHSNIVEILMNSGLVGFFVFYGFYFVAIFKFFKNINRYKEASRISILLFALFMSFTVCGTAMVYYYERYVMFLMMTVYSGLKVFDGKKDALPEAPETDRT